MKRFNNKQSSGDISFAWSLCIGFILAILFCVPLFVSAQTYHVKFQTDRGNFTVMLYDGTPIHRDNFVNLVKRGFYDGIIFHRVIESFMIQAGDSATRNAQPGVVYGDEENARTLPAEILYPRYYHKRGALAAAREGDDVNPERRSSSTQFYIVWGRMHSPGQLERIRKNNQRTLKQPFEIPDSICEQYYFPGGTPWLDGQYTVFGEVIEGLEAIEEIQLVMTDENDRPLSDVKILKAELVEAKEQ